MKRKLAEFLAFLLVCSFCAFPSGVSARESAALQADETGVSLQYEFRHQFVPAYSHLYGSAMDSFAAIRLTNSGGKSVPVLVQSWIEGISGTVEEEAVIMPGESLVINQSPGLTAEAYDSLNEQREGIFRVRVTQKGGDTETVLHDERAEITVLPRRSFVWQDGLDSEGNHQLLSSWVTPDAPAVRTLLLLGADYLDSQPMPLGYDGSELDESGAVWQRLEAIWRAIGEYEITTELLEGAVDEYSMIQLRTPYDVLKEGNADYVEKALLFASATESAGLETALIFTPEQRVYAGVRMDETTARYYFIDTSFIGLDSFDKAAAQGSGDWERLNDHLGQAEEGYHWLDLRTLRDKGFGPMPFSQEKAGSDDTLVESLPGDIDIRYIYNAELITSLYHLYGNLLDDFLKVYLTNRSSEPVSLVVESEVRGYSTAAAATVVAVPGERLTVRLNPRLETEAVNALNSRRPGSLTVRVTRLKEGEDELLLNDNVEINIYSRRDFIWVDGFTDQEVFELYAAWVTPNDPAVEEMIRRAADYTDSGVIISGYGGVLKDENGSVWDRLEAIWKVQEDYGITYVSTMVVFDGRQRVRTPYEVIEQRSGNCIETSLLYASAAEAMGLEAAIIRIPGHAYVAVRTDQVNARYYFIETTMIGYSSFSEAVATGGKQWDETKPHLNGEDEGYHWIGIVEAREKGILPMPWR